VIAAGYRQPPAITREHIESIRLPTLLIDGSASKPIFRNTCDILGPCFPIAKRVTLLGASHALGMEVPGPFMKRS
jgi:hypothetical protein